MLGQLTTCWPPPRAEIRLRRTPYLHLPATNDSRVYEGPCWLLAPVVNRPSAKQKRGRFSPNPPDGVRTVEGGKGVTGAIRARRASRRLLHSQWPAVAVAQTGTSGRTRQESLADQGWRGRSVVRWMAQTPALPSGRPSGSQAEARLMGWPALGKLRRAEWVSRPAREHPAGGSWWSRPARADRNFAPSSGPGCGPSPVPPARRRGGEAARGEMVPAQPTVLEVAGPFSPSQRASTRRPYASRQCPAVGDEAVKL